MTTFNIAAIQMAVSRDMREAEIYAANKVRMAAQMGADVICLPELYRSPYFCQKEDITLFDLAEAVPGPSTDLFAPLSKELGVTIIVPIFEKRAPGLYHNSAIIFDHGSFAGIYRKMHIPDDPNYYEKFYFAPGDTGFRSFNIDRAKIGVLICWDQWYPEAARLTALQGAEVIFYPTAIGWLPRDKEQYGDAQRDAWKTMQRSHAIANGVYVAVANRVGFESSDVGDGLEFWGNSFICDPEGKIIAESNSSHEDILIAEVDTDKIEFIRREWPFLRDRRIDAYSGITNRYK
jgi:N-carbamoylputrescine amidase